MTYLRTDVVIRNYSAGIAEMWVDKKHVCYIGTSRVLGGKYGEDYERSLLLIKALGRIFGFGVIRLNYEQNEEYQQEIDSAL